MTYSLDFLRDDWDGAGFDFGFACIFNGECMTQGSVIEFVRGITNAAPDVSLRLISEDNESIWRFIPRDEVRMFLSSTWTWKSTQLLVVDVTTRRGFSGYVELNQPDQVIVGGPSENFFTGDCTHDRALAQDTIDFVEVAVSAFGDGYGCFGAGGNAIQEAIGMRENGEVNNLTAAMNSEVLASQITRLCTDLREQYGT